MTAYELSPQQVSPHQTSWLTLHWLATAEVQHDYVIALQLHNQADEEVAYWLGRPVRSGYPTQGW